MILASLPRGLAAGVLSVAAVGGFAGRAAAPPGLAQAPKPAPAGAAAKPAPATKPAPAGTPARTTAPRPA
ncbi:MAG: hypothetical protein ABWY78_03005, partial [Microvirga sp.]